VNKSGQINSAIVSRALPSDEQTVAYEKREKIQEKEEKGEDVED